MKRKILWIVLALCLLPIAFASSDAEAQIAGEAPMNNYCAVPPYVIENVTPNIMLLVDNSGSMYNFSYACPTTTATATGASTTSIPVSSVAGFKVNQSIMVGANQAWITAIDTGTNTLTVGASTSFALNATVQDFGCYSPSSGTQHFYCDGSSTCSSTVPCSTSGTTTAAGTLITALQVSSTDYAKFSTSQHIVVVHGSTFTPETISSKSTSSGKYYLNVNTPVTVSSGDTIVDASCYSSSSASIPVGSVSNFYSGQPVVILRGTTPYITKITAPPIR